MMATKGGRPVHTIVWYECVKLSLQIIIIIVVDFNNCRSKVN